MRRKRIFYKVFTELHIAYALNEELYFLCVSTTVTFHTIKLNCYLAKLRQVVFSRCYAPNSLKASQAIVVTVEIQCEWVGTLTNDQQWIRRGFPKNLHFKCLLHCDRQATEKPKLMRFSQILVASSKAILPWQLCMDFHIAATSVLQSHQQNALSGSGQNDRPGGGEKFPYFFEDAWQIVCRCATGWILLTRLWLIVTACSGLGQTQYQANIINAPFA